MMVRIVSTLRFIFCTDYKVAARHCFEETSHVITASGHNVLAHIDFFLSYSGNGSIVYDLSHFCIIHTGWTAVNYFYHARTTHGGCYTLRNLGDTAYEFTAMILIKCSHGAVHLSAFRNDIERSTSLDGANGDNGRTKRR